MNIQNPEKISCIIDRVIFCAEETGWSVIRVSLMETRLPATVIAHQASINIGSHYEFEGQWIESQKFGRQFKAARSEEKKPQTTEALEKYLSSGLIRGVGPATAKRIVSFFKEETIDVFDHDIDRLMTVPGIAKKKLTTIRESWKETQSQRNVMIFLQKHDVSLALAVRIGKEYGDHAISKITEDPYVLSRDFHGVGFSTADKVALSLGHEEDSEERIRAAIEHILLLGKNDGHCYLTCEQIHTQVMMLLDLHLGENLNGILRTMEKSEQLKVRTLSIEGAPVACYYPRSLYYDEKFIADALSCLTEPAPVDYEETLNWVEEYCSTGEITLSGEQMKAVAGVVSHAFSVLAGAPGCGKTTTTLVIVKLLESMQKNIALAAPTGRAAQRMSEVIGYEAKTIHRLLEMSGGGFKRNEDNPLDVDFLIIDEASMLDVNLSAALFKALPENAQMLWIGDADQLPSVGAGDILSDIIDSNALPCYRLTQIFRQAKSSSIIKYAHAINAGQMPRIPSPFNRPQLWQEGADCLFIDSDQATQTQMDFIAKVRRKFGSLVQSDPADDNDPAYNFRVKETITRYEDDFTVPDQFRHADLAAIALSERDIDAYRLLLANVHPWSSLNYHLSALDVVQRLYCEWIPKYLGEETEIQILTPMTRGSLGTINLNNCIQAAINPPEACKDELKIGDKLFRVGDRVIHKKNNYDLNVFNGDIGRIIDASEDDVTCSVLYASDQRRVVYNKEAMFELDLAYAITIHKSQGSEFDAVIMPILGQHYKMLYRKLFYTGLTRAKRLCVMAGSRQALSTAVNQRETVKRQTGLRHLLSSTE